MNLTALQAALAQVDAAKKNLRSEQLPKMQDKSLSLDERWSIFVLLADAGVLGHDSYGDGHLDYLGPNFTQYDDFHNDRHALVKFTEMYNEMTVENPEKFVGADIDGWREKVLEVGVGTFEHDW